MSPSSTICPAGLSTTSRPGSFIHGTVTDSALVDRLFMESRFDHVYHLAAYAAEGLSHFIKRFNYTNNVIGSVNLAERLDQP